MELAVDGQHVVPRKLIVFVLANNLRDFDPQLNGLAQAASPKACITYKGIKAAMDSVASATKNVCDVLVLEQVTPSGQAKTPRTPLFSHNHPKPP